METLHLVNMCRNPTPIRLPISFKNPNGRTIPVPCGKCPKCVKAKISSWLFRLEQEARIHPDPFFVTLTYDSHNVPHTYQYERPEPVIPYRPTIAPWRGRHVGYTLRKKDIQDFMKRLRFHYSKVSKKKLRYYCVGEYGTKFRRPHYHLILFNLDYSFLIPIAWDKGFTDYSIIRDMAAISYTLKYISKPHVKSWPNAIPQYSQMSQGLGRNYLNMAAFKYHNQSYEHAHLLTRKGFTVGLPKYYKDKLYDEVYFGQQFCQGAYCDLDTGEIVGVPFDVLSRDGLTEYLQQRIDKLDAEKLHKYMVNHPWYTYEQCLKNLNINAANLKYEKRLTEIF